MMSWPFKKLEIVDPQIYKNQKKMKKQMLRKPLNWRIQAKLLCGNDSSSFFQPECTWKYWIWMSMTWFQAIFHFFLNI